MAATIFYAIALPAAFFFTIFPWFLAAGGTLSRAAPFIAASALVVAGLRPFYRRALASEPIDPAVSRRSRRRVAFGAILIALAIPVAGVCYLGASEAFKSGSATRIQGAKRIYAENENEIDRLEAEIAQQTSEHGEQYVDGYLRGERARRIDSRPRLEEDVRNAETASTHGWIGAAAATTFLAASLYYGVRSIRWSAAASV